MKTYNLFFAIPFDNIIKSIYEKDIIPVLEKTYGGKLRCVIGNKQVSSSGKYDTIETFKMQNSELFKHFVNEIRKADVIVADLTFSNPNVHVELGIALSYNKNILRITSQSYERLTFDIRNYEAQQYENRKDLIKIIKNYLDLFFKIKELDFKDLTEKESSNLFYNYPEKKELFSWDQGAKQNFQTNQLPVYAHYDSGFYLRDGKVQVTFKMLDQREHTDWFGVYLRSEVIPLGSILVYVRKNGNLEIKTYPINSKWQIIGRAECGTCNGPKKLTIELEGDYIKASVNGMKEPLEREGLNIQTPGEVKFASLLCNTEFWDTKIVCRDTIETFDNLR